MKNRKTKCRFSLLLLCLSLITSSCISGCKKKEKDEPVYSGEYYFSSYENNDFSDYLDSIPGTVKEDTLFAEAFYEKTGKFRSLFCKEDGNYLIFDDKGPSQYEMIELPFQDRCVAACPGENETIWVMTEELDSSFHSSHSLRSYSIADASQTTPFTCPELTDQSIVRLSLASDHSFVIATKESVYILTPDGTLEQKISPSGNAQIEDMSVSESGMVGVIYTLRDKSYTHTLTLFNSNGKKEDSFNLPDYSEGTRIFGRTSGFGNSFFVVSNAFVGMFDTETKNWSHWVKKDSTPATDSQNKDGGKELIYKNSGIDLVVAACKNGENISFYGAADGILQSMNGFFTLSFHNYNSDRKTIRLGRLENGLTLDYLDQIVDYYNRMQNQYFIEILDYRADYDSQLSSADNWRKSVTSLLSDLLTGQGPDLYLVQPSVQKALSKQSGLEDLSPYLAKMDRSSYLPGIWELFDAGFEEKQDNAIHFFSPFFTISGMAYDNSLKSEYSASGTYTDWISYSESKSQYMTGFHESAVSLFSIPACEILSTVSEKEDAIQLLTALFEEEVLFNKHNKNMSGLDLDHPILCPVDIRSFQSYLDVASSFESGVFIENYPDTGSSMGLYFDNCLCISSASKNKDAAWDFLSLLLLPQVQLQISEDRIPIHMAAFEKSISQVGTADIPGDSDSMIREIKGYPTYPLRNVSELSENYRNMVTDLLARSNQLHYEDEYIDELCYDMINSVREGITSPKDAAVTLYNQASKYLQEQS